MKEEFILLNLSDGQSVILTSELIYTVPCNSAVMRHTAEDEGNRDCHARQYDAVEACRMMESVRASTYLVYLGDKG